MRKKYHKVLAAALAMSLVLQSSLVYASPEYEGEGGYDSSESITEELNEEFYEDTDYSEDEKFVPEKSTEAADVYVPSNILQNFPNDLSFERVLFMPLDEGDSDTIHLQSAEAFAELSQLPANTYQNSTIVITRATEDNFNLDETVTPFIGFGSEEYPFKGTLIVTNGDTNDIVITTNHSLFNYVDQSAIFGEGLFLQAGEDISGPILAQNYVNETGRDTAGYISVKLGGQIADEEDGTTYSFAGIIGTMAENTKLSLSVQNKSSEKLQLRSQDENLGLFCNTMLEGAHLTVAQYAGTSDFVLSAENGHAGGAVGYMAAGAELDIDTVLSLTGIVEASGTQKAAGGLVGKAENAVIRLNAVVTVDETIKAEGASAAGGYIGDAEFNEELQLLDLGNFKIQKGAVVGGNHSGGLFGVLKYSGSGIFEISNMDDFTVAHSGTSWQFGGLAGIYTAKFLSAELRLENIHLKTEETGSVTSKGGLIGFVGDSTSDGAVTGAEASFISVKDVSITVDGNATNNGGLIGEMGADSHFLTTAGTVKVGCSAGKTMGGTAVGGLVGASHAGIIRLTGTTDLSDVRFAGTGVQYGQILGARGLNTEAGTLCYALGLGDGNGTSTYGWKLIRPTAPMAVSDTGCYGDVIRLDGVELTESVRTGAFIAPSGNPSATEVLSFYTDKHQVIPNMQITGDVVIRSKRDFVVASILFQFGATTVKKGAFNKYGSTGSDLLKKKVTLDSSLGTLDLSDTGVVGLLKDNGVQTFAGTFEGNNCVLKLAAGQKYGVGSGDMAGCGQLYNHESIGLLGVMNGTVKDLVLDGSIDFGMTNGGAAVYCGAAAGKVQEATVENVTVKTAISYDTGATGTAIPISYVGGYFGATAANTKTISFTGCNMQSTIKNSCTAYNYYLGGYVGFINNSSIIVNVADCAIEGASLSADIADHARIGGLIAAVDGSGNAHTVNVNGLTIAGLEISNQATATSGGLLGYFWRGTTFNAENIVIKNNVLNTTGRFGGLVYEASGYWKIGNGTDTPGITFTENNTFEGISSAASPSALLLGTANDTGTAGYAAYVEIKKDGLQIEDNSVTVTLSQGGQYFDDLVGITKFGKAANAAVSIGLTEQGASDVVLIDTDEMNTWTNHCLVNGASDYQNSKTRYYYNLDFYRQPASDGKSSLALGSAVDSAGDLLCWSVYMDCTNNIRTYFAKSVGGKITGNIDLTGVSYYPSESFLDIKDAEITFAYESMNAYEEAGVNRKFNDANRQHYQMQTGLFTDIITVITTNINSSTLFNVDNLTLRGTFGPYTETKGGVLLCSSAVGGDATYKTIISLNNIVLDGIRCTDTEKPLLINSLGKYTTTSVLSVTTTEEYSKEGETAYAAGSLIGKVGDASALGINIDFSDIGLDARTDAGAVKVYGTNHTIFTKATLLESFQYADEASGGSYNFESGPGNVTYGKEISNTDSGRNKASDGETNQYCYFDTYGSEEYVKDPNGPGTTAKDISVRFAAGYLPYVGVSEEYNGNKSYHELDINQKAYYIIDGCGTYGHPYQIKTIRDEEGNELVTADKQMMAIADILDGHGNGTVLLVNTEVLKAKKDSADLHTEEDGSEHDMLYIKDTGFWYPARAAGKHYKKISEEGAVSTDDMLCYVRNAYYEIEESFTIDLSGFNGIGASGGQGAFSGVIVGKQQENGEYPTITLECANGRMAKGTVVGGLIRYSQGCVVKDLNIAFGNISLGTPKTAQEPACFGGVIGWEIGGDNIIDNVNVGMAEGGNIMITGDYNWLTAIGGYVGYVSSNDCIMGGGVVFRRMTSGGLLNVSYRNDEADSPVSVNTALETDGLHPTTDRYYWNPYIGRVLEGYACAEVDTCAGMGDNTNKNYKIPKIDRNDKFTIKNNEIGKNYKRDDIPIRSTTTIDSPQDLWVLSSIVNSGVACRATNDQLLKTAAGNNQTVSNAYFIGRARTGYYENIGTTSWSMEDARDDADAWGGVEDLWPEVNYLTTFTDNYIAADYLTIDVGYREITLLQNDYDMRDYGNGFRGIGASYFYDAATSNAHFALKLRMMRIAGKALEGNGSTIEYLRNIYEYDVEPVMNFYRGDNPFQTRQAGLFNLYNQKNAKGVVSNLDIYMEITTNQTVNRVDVTEAQKKSQQSADQYRTAFGGLGGRTAYNYDNALVLDNVKIHEGSLIENAYYAGGFIGKIINQGVDNISYVIQNSNVSRLYINNAVFAGAFMGQNPRKLEIYNSTADGNVIAARNEDTTCYLGGLVGQTQSNVTIDGVTVSNTSILTRKLTRTSTVLGGIVGNISGNVPIQMKNVSVSGLKAGARGYAGGVAGSMTGNTAYALSNIDIQDSCLSTAAIDRYAGSIVGHLTNGSLNVFNARSKDNVIGYLITTDKNKKFVLDGNEVSLTDASGEIDLSLMNDENIALRQNNNTSGNYWPYSVIKEDSSKLITDSHVGIWVGNANSRDVKIVAASRIGDYSAVKSIGRNATASSYVVYSDYTGTAAADEAKNKNAASFVNVSPDSGIVFPVSKKLTGDGACLTDGAPIANTIISDTLEDSYMKGYFGANTAQARDAIRGLDTLVKNFNEDYGSILSTYLTEETTASYSGTDIPILVLEMTSSAEINELIKNYISVLTNLDQTKNAKYISIVPTTYKWDGNKWAIAEVQSMTTAGENLLKLNAGKYDNTKNQITVIDVTYQSPIANSKDVYHLYIPVLVKKVMDVSFAVKVVNGAVGFESAYNGTDATLASYGEDYTAKLTYSYEWTAAEWNDAISSGVDLMWSFDKQVNLDRLTAIDLSKMRLTLVDMNTHGTGKTFFRAPGTIIDEDGTVLFADFTDFESVPIVDLLKLKEEEGTEEMPGTLKRVDENDSSATVRRWDADAQSFVYYATKDEESDPEDTVYYNVKLDGNYKSEDPVSVSEIYYLVMNCTEGQGMQNKLVSLGTNKLSGAVPSRVYSSGTSTYVLGDFYALKNMVLHTEGENASSTVMRPGTNDYIDVDVSTDIAVSSESFASYVNNRAVYFRYALHMTDEDLLPVEIKAASTFVSALKIGDTEIRQVQNLNEASQGYVLETSGNTTYITIKTKGSDYIGQKITASVRYYYDDGVSLIEQFPVRAMETDKFGVKFKAVSSMAYEYTSLGNTNMTSSKDDDKLYYTQESAVASLNYDSYNITSYDGNTSQLGLNDNEIKNGSTRIKSRAMFDATTVSGLNRTDLTNARYPYYLEGTISLGKKTEDPKPNGGIGKTYEDVAIQNYLSDFVISCDDADIDVSSDGLGLQDDGTYKFRIKLTKQQVADLLTDKVLINIDYSVRTSKLEEIIGAQYANYKVTLRASLKNKSLDLLTNEPTDYLIYTNARVYLGIIGVTDTDE